MNIKDFKTLDQLNPLMGVISDNDLMLIKPANKTDAYKETFANVKNKILANVPTDLGGFTNNAGYLKADDIANKADKATSLAGYGINDAYTKTQVDSKVEDLNDKITAIGSPLKWIASATPAAIAALTPQTGLKEGHVYTVSQDGNIGNLAVKEGDEVAWNGIEWFIVGHTKVVPVTPDWSSASGQPGYIANKPTNVAESGITDVYTKTEVNNELGNKSNTGHTHQMSDVTGLDTALAGKAASTHGHTMNEVSGLSNALAGKSDTGHTHNISDITNLPQSDWNQSNTDAKDYVKNKPELKIEADGSKTDRKKVTLGSSQQSFLTDHQKIPAQVQSDWNESDTEAAGFIKNKPSIPAAQIQSDWNQTNTSAKDFIKNKPNIPAAQIQSDWNQSDTTAKDYIKNKPDLKIEADESKTDRKKVTLGSQQQTFLTQHQTIPPQAQADWNESDTDAASYIKNKPSIPAAQIQSDWNQTNSGALDFIKNKPSIPSAQIQSDWNQSDNQALDFIKNKPTVPTIEVDGESDPLTALKLKAGRNISITVDSNGWTVISYDGY